MAQKRAPFGTWESPITAEAIAKGAIAFQDVVADPITNKVYHLESRPSEGGRVVIVDTRAGSDVFGPGWDARTGVQEYGGAAAIVYNDIVYFSHFKDGRVYRLDLNSKSDPVPVTPESSVHRFAAFAINPAYTDILVAVFEDHTVDTPKDVVNTLCQINVKTKTVSNLVKGDDFYAGPKFSPNGKSIAWQQWSHPDMPWEGGIVYTADFVTKDGGNSFEVQNTTYVGGKASSTSVAFPSWASNDTLLFTSDESGYINPWKFQGGKASALLPKPVQQEFGEPMWTLNTFPYGFVDDEGRYALFKTFIDGRNALQLVDIQNPSSAQVIESPYVVINFLTTVSRQFGALAFVGVRADEEPSIVQVFFVRNVTGQFDVDFKVLKSSPSLAPDSGSFKEYISEPQPHVLKAHTQEDIHVVYYPPKNPNYAGSSIDGELPPLVVNVHGGPTSIRDQGLYWGAQYFTTRGFAWLDVNYGGSSGYGRTYIDRLVKEWGVVDVSDCVDASQAIAVPPYNLADPKRLVIRGGSAGGFTTLAALATAPDVAVFAAGTSSYGISALKPLEENTHKFESHYMWNLLGGSSEEIPDVYHDRSPLYSADRIVSPLLILQGELDRVVPKEQAEAIVKTIQEKGGKVEYQLYAGEGHGWRQEATIKDALERELAFYVEVLKLNA